MEQIDWVWIWIFQGIAWYLGYRYGTNRTAIRFTKMLIDRNPELERNIQRAREEIQRIQEGSDGRAEELKVERHGDQLYVYVKSTDEFLAQGATLQECLDAISQRYPGRTFQGLLSPDQADQLGVTVK